MPMMKLVMIGHGMVGHKFIESVLEHNNDDLEITIIAEEPRLAYDRVHLTEYFSGRSAKDLSLARADFADAYGIDLHLNTKAIAIDRHHQTVTTATGQIIGYDKLILATGSMPLFRQFRAMSVKTALFTAPLKTLMPFVQRV
jgi:nitrite reductase (NADH) large subunit